MNFIMKLLKLKGFNAILNMIDWLIKERYYIVYTTTDKNMIAKNIIKVLYKNVWRIYNLFNTIILNRDS